MYIRNATPADADRIMEIIDAAKIALRELGTDQWQYGYPNMTSTLADIEAGISRVLVDDDGRVVATAAVYIGHEPTYEKIYDGKWLTDNEVYGIIHRIAVDAACKNKGAASRFMAYCEELSRAAGVTSMRCDTHFGNAIMQHTLEKNGYVRCGMNYIENGHQRASYEKLL